ncbi:MAG: hypothetical protein K6G76_03975 [Lachnospiraceae bacterium]|nr:hypothetical protein [Lachnospiraceae bacterium]
MNSFTKNIGIIICGLYIFLKLQNQKPTKKYMVGLIMFILFSSVGSVCIDLYMPILTDFSIIVGSIIFVHLSSSESIGRDYPIKMWISFSLSYVLFIISVLITTIALFSVPRKCFDLYAQPISLIIQILLMIALFKIKRIKTGVKILDKRIYSVPVAIIGAGIIFLMTLINLNTYSKLYIIVYTSFYFLSILIFVYWRASITRSYLERLGNRNIASLNEELLQKDEYIKKLEADVERLGKIVHRDNKLVPAMEMAVERFIMDESGEMSVGSELLEELRKMSKDRKGLVTTSVNAAEPSVNTGVAKVDNLITYMSEKAANEGITLKVTVGIDIKELFDKCIDEESFCTLLADLLDNAIIATKYNNARDVLLDMSMIKKAPAIHIFDSGISFDKEVLINYGIEQTTTHGDDGGSGIGLMQTYEILAKCRASIFIDEFSSGLYTKKISVVFDRKRQFLLYTPREDSEVSFLKRRADLTVVRK